MIMIINVRVHVWAQKLITYFKTVCVGWVLCVISVQIAYRDISHIVGDHRVPEVLSEVLPNNNSVTDWSQVLAAAMQADSSPYIAVTIKKEKRWSSGIFGLSNDLM